MGTALAGRELGVLIRAAVQEILDSCAPMPMTTSAIQDTFSGRNYPRVYTALRSLERSGTVRCHRQTTTKHTWWSSAIAYTECRVCGKATDNLVVFPYRRYEMAGGYACDRRPCRLAVIGMPWPWPEHE